MAICVYVLCSLASSAVAITLFRTYWRTKVRFLLWSTLCFSGLALGNVLLFVDVILFANGPDLSILRLLPSLAGYSVLIYGFIWDVL
ncbi:MAG: hypothetical protein EOP11_25295 [Proteobacteria bacterium]|nr:MAG: hypothetical protein EOP11_25295 [Pseudomonadota bacterium]